MIGGKSLVIAKVLKKKVLCGVICANLLFYMNGCGNVEPVHVSHDVVVSLIPDETYIPDSTPIQQEELSEVELYIPDDNAEYLVPCFVQSQKTPESLIDDLISKGALPKGTKMNSFVLKDNGQYISLDDEVASMSDKLTAEIDLSGEFVDEVTHTGTAGESMLMGCIVNTMIKNYNLKSISVLGDGKVIDTGHNIYDEPQVFYGDLIEK